MSDFTTATRIVHSASSEREDLATDEIFNLLEAGADPMELATSLAGVAAVLMIRYADACNIDVDEVAREIMSVSYWADSEWAESNE